MNRFHLISLIVAIAIEQVASQCGGANGGNGYFAHESQCDRYYVCENGRVVNEGLCDDGLVFNEYGNPSRLRCELPFGIDCSNRPNLQPPKPTGECPRQNGMFPDPRDCTKFIECGNGEAHIKSCASGLAYNKANGNCDWPENTPECPAEALLGFTCPQPTQRELQLFGNPRYAHPTDCKMLYACIPATTDPLGPRTPRLLGCEEGYVFNGETGSCDSPKNVRGCENYYGNTIEVNNRLIASSS